MARVLGEDAPPGDRAAARRPLRDRRRLARRRRPQPWPAVADQGRRRDPRGRDHVRLDRLIGRGAYGLQLAVRRDDRVGYDIHHADDLPGRGHISRLRSAERGHARAGEGGRAQGLHLQPQLPSGLFRTVLPGSARRRPCTASARPGRSRRRSRPATPPTCTSSPTPGSSRRSRSTGSISRSTRVPTAGGPAATAWTESIA